MVDAHYIGTDNGTKKFKGGGTFKLRPFSGKRYLDDFDYVSFLNGECIFRKNCASVPEERSAIPLQTEQSSAG